MILNTAKSLKKVLITGFDPFGDEGNQSADTPISAIGPTAYFSILPIKSSIELALNKCSKSIINIS